MEIKLHRYRRIFLVFLSLSFSLNLSFAQLLKSIVYDFDGLDINQTDLPEGDYSVADLTYKVATNPLASNDMIGDRVLKLNLTWSAAYGTFGRGISRYIEFDPITDKFNFYFYNPASNNQSATFDVVIGDDDNQNNTYENASDDVWKKSFVIPASSGWQLFSAPLSSFTDSNTGGNGIFDIAFTQNKGMLLMVEFRFKKATAGLSNPTFYLDMINFSDGNLPTGATALDLPPKNPNDYCLLGAYHDNDLGQEYLIPSQVESLFPVVPGKKLKYANYYLHFAYDGTTVAKALPGIEVQNLINNGYRPIITWEPLFTGYDKLDSRQPRLSNIMNGDYNSYIDQVADKIKTFGDTVVIRFMHEFEGDWYSWSLTENGQDPNLYISAFRKVVDRFRARGANNVKWMWCINSNYFPHLSYNWVVKAYPGDTYVDIIANDVYNNISPPELPSWRSFRSQTAESYYYLTKYFPLKPIFLCEFGCRERFATEDPTSESKGAWYARTDKELQSNFHKIRALIFFNSAPDQNWFLNSSSSSLLSLTNNIWYDNYYFGPPSQAGKLAVSITSPSTYTTKAAGSTMVITAAAAGGTGSFQKVEFFNGATKLGEDLTSPYSYSWTNIATGDYVITAKVTDIDGATAVSPIVDINVIVTCSAFGLISRDVWNNITGSTVSTIPLTTAPSSTGTLNIFEAPGNFGDNYGQRIRGYLCPPVTGNYILWIASDNASELWLSTDALPANKHKIASVSGYTMSREWTKYSTQQSVAVNLVVGQKYYIEALHKEINQGDNLAVGWQLPDGTRERPIPGVRLSPYTSPLLVNLTSPVNNSIFNEGSTILLQAAVSGGTGTFQKIEFFNGTTKLGEDLTSPYSFSWNSVPKGNYQITAKGTDSDGTTAVSSIINMDVIVPCTATGSISREVWNNITGSTVSSIPLTTAPSSTSALTIFETPMNFADNYGQRVRGYICPPYSGNYIFWISSDNTSELWISTDDLPANKHKIASVSGYTMTREWTKYASQQSAPVHLVAGQKYYIEALHQEGTQGDNLAVGWELPNGTKERPIPGSRLSPFGPVIPPPPPAELISAGSSWKYLDNGTDQGTAWRATTFNDGTWKTGNSELGYGDGGEATIVGYGPSASTKYVTTYFRKKFNLASLSGISALELNLIRDDGAVVYLNGQEVYRNNMPAGTINYGTLASSLIDGPAESFYVVAGISLSALVVGDNVVAVEMHQQNVTSLDLSFNLRLKTSATNIVHDPNFFAIIGDYGKSGPNEDAVANLVKSWKPDYIISMGDNNYPAGSAATIDANIGEYYHDYIKPYSGIYGNEADINRFFPCMGNHDTMTANAAPYLQYFTLPGNERYFDFVKGDINFFVINSNPSEPDGTSATSIQATWLRNKLAASTSKWKIVYFHHSPYVSDVIHGSQAFMQWPFKAWGADAVLSGHSHIYERVINDSFPYIVNGLGGESKYSLSATPVVGSQKRYNADYGAIKVAITPDTLWFKFYNVVNGLIDSYPVTKAVSLPTIRSVSSCEAKITPGSSTTFCEGGKVMLRTDKIAGYTYQWIKNEIEIPGETTLHYSASSDGDYQVKISSPECTAWSAPTKVTVNNTLTARITASGPTTFCVDGKVKLYANTCDDYIYQWKKDDSDIPGATRNTYEARTPGNYQVKIIYGSSVAWSALVNVIIDPCSDNDSTTILTDSDPLLKSSDEPFRVNVYPNPTTGIFSFNFCLEDATAEMVEVKVINALGQDVYNQPSSRKSGSVKETIELGDKLPTGFYVLQIRIGNKIENTKLLLKR